MQDDDALEDEFVLARKPIRLSFPSADCGVLTDAREAVRREFRESVKWKRLRCRKVSVLSEGETGTVYILDVGQSVEFDWTWEGAIAFRPVVLKEFIESPQTLLDEDEDDVAAADSVIWSGEVLEVDETRGRIYICVSDPEARPTTGSFYARVQKSSVVCRLAGRRYAPAHSRGSQNRLKHRGTEGTEPLLASSSVPSVPLCFYISF